LWHGEHHTEVLAVIDKIIVFTDLSPEKGIDYSRVQLRRKEIDGTFPQRVRMSAGRVGWYKSEIDAWIASRPRGILPRKVKQLPAGQKNPTGIVASFALDCSRDPAQWAAWAAANPNCNFGLVAGPSRMIVVDTDAKDDRNAAWAMRCALFAEWGLPADLMPQVQSARGGWHDLCNFAIASPRKPVSAKRLLRYGSPLMWDLAVTLAIGRCNEVPFYILPPKTRLTCKRVGLRWHSTWGLSSAKPTCTLCRAPLG
jgi:hypothetical protein